MNWFCAGSLCHDALRLVVLGREVSGKAARLTGHVLSQGVQGGWSVLTPAAGVVTGGLLLTGLSEAEMARLEFFHAILGQAPVMVALEAGVGLAPVYVGAGAGGWSPDVWLAQYAETAVATAQDVMALRGRAPAVEVAARRL